MKSFFFFYRDAEHGLYLGAHWRRGYQNAKCIVVLGCLKEKKTVLCPVTIGKETQKYPSKGYCHQPADIFQQPSYESFNQQLADRGRVS